MISELMDLEFISAQVNLFLALRHSN